MSDKTIDDPDWGFCDVPGCKNPAAYLVEGGSYLCDEHKGDKKR